MGLTVKQQVLLGSYLDQIRDALVRINEILDPASSDSERVFDNA